MMLMTDDVLQTLSARAGVGAEFDAERAKEVIGPLMSIVSKNVDDAVKSDTIEGMKEDAPVRIYYTVSALLYVNDTGNTWIT